MTARRHYAGAGWIDTEPPDCRRCNDTGWIDTEEAVTVRRCPRCSPPAQRHRLAVAAPPECEPCAGTGWIDAPGVAPGSAATVHRCDACNGAGHRAAAVAPVVPDAATCEAAAVAGLAALAAVVGRPRPDHTATRPVPASVASGTGQAAWPNSLKHVTPTMPATPARRNP